MNTNFKVIGLTRLGIKPKSTTSDADALPLGHLSYYQSLVCLLLVKMLNLTFTSRKLIFLLEEDYDFSVPPLHKQNFKEDISGFKVFPGFQF